MANIACPEARHAALQKRRCDGRAWRSRRLSGVRWSVGICSGINPARSGQSPELESSSESELSSELSSELESSS